MFHPVCSNDYILGNYRTIISIVISTDAVKRYGYSAAQFRLATFQAHGSTMCLLAAILNSTVQQVWSYLGLTFLVRLLHRWLCILPSSGGVSCLVFSFACVILAAVHDQWLGVAMWSLPISIISSSFISHSTSVRKKKKKVIHPLFGGQVYSSYIIGRILPQPSDNKLFTSIL